MFNLEESIKGLEQAKKNREGAAHMWLYGFYQIINNSEISKCSAEMYINQRRKAFPDFSRLHSGVQMSNILQALVKDKRLSDPVNLGKIKADINDITKNMLNGTALFYAHLPVNGEYHLEFPLLNVDERLRFVYSLCDQCEGMEEHGFPEINCRQSVKLPEMGGAIFYDNRISVARQPIELIRQEYEVFKDFIDSTRLN